MYNYLNTRDFAGVDGSSESSRRPNQPGVPQGSLLVPVLFSPYINVVPFIVYDNNMAPALYTDEMDARVRSVSIKLAVRK
jgi:hypothetical protein